MKTVHRVKVMLLSTTFLFFTMAGAASVAGAQGGYGMMGPGMMQGGMIGPGMGGRHGMMSGCGKGRGMMGPGNRGAMPFLSPEERQKITEARAEFWKQTEDLRGDIYRKRLERRIEMSKKSPDEATVMKIEDELLALKGQLAKLRIKHRLALKAINPRLGMMGGGMMGPGMMRGGMMQGCGMMGPGKGGRHGMMGQGMGGLSMMRPGMGMGGPGMMGGGGMQPNPAAGAPDTSPPTTTATPQGGSDKPKTATQ